MKNQLSALFISLSLLAPTGQAKPTTIFTSTDHCVAWKARKVMMLVRTVEPVGKNCSIQTLFQKNADGKYQFIGEFPIDKFNSDEPDRDKEVGKILKSQDNANINFSSLPLTKEEWLKILSSGTGEVQGSVTAAGKTVPLTFKINIQPSESHYLIFGEVISDYSTFSLTPPSVGGGLVAKAKNYLEFHFHFLSQKISLFDEVTLK